MLGRTLGRYQVTQRLGEGGAGIVFRAVDTRLGRDVALKVLNESALQDPRALERFRQEARALSRLVHPNIATLFDFDSDRGIDFLVLEFVQGDTLARLLQAGPLPESRARAIARDVAEALETAHDQGIVHRDLKPSNIVITPRGRAKVLDFGIARLLGEGTSAERAVVTDQGALVGTLRYMAPEQVHGGTVDPRTDLYSLGVVLFEMVTGEWPYERGSAARMVFQIASAEPRRLRDVRSELSSELEEIVARCLAKESTRRPATAGALAKALKGEDADETSRRRLAETSGERQRIRAVAVLPLENRSGDPEQDFFVDGMTDQLIADLAQIGALRVISRTSSMRYRGTAKPLPTIARELNVDAIVEGSVLRFGDRVRVTAQLVDASSDASVWAKSYEGDLSDVLQLQHEVARAIADGIRVRVTAEEATRFARHEAVNPAAHIAYLRGRYLWNRWDTQSLLDSVAHYEEALRADPRYARAWAGLADSYGVLGNTNVLPPAEAYEKARSAAFRGLALDDSLAELHASLSYVHRFYDWDWPAAERELLRALALNPGYATARRWYAQFLSTLARHDEAIAEAERALELDPLSLIIHTAVGDCLFYARRYDRAVWYYERSLEMDPAFGPGHTDLARALEHLGRPEEALEHFLAGTTRSAGQPVNSAGLAIMLFRAGKRNEASAVMDRVLERATTEFVSPYAIGSYYAVTGDNERALDWLEKAYAVRDGTITHIKVHPRLDGLRHEPRFRDLLGSLRLE